MEQACLNLVTGAKRVEMIGFTRGKIEEKYFKHFKNSICLENECAIPLTDEKFQTALIPCGTAILKPRNSLHVTELKYAKNSQRAVRVARANLDYFDRSRQNSHYICRACGPKDVILSIRR